MPIDMHMSTYLSKRVYDEHHLFLQLTSTTAVVDSLSFQEPVVWVSEGALFHSHGILNRFRIKNEG